MDGRKIFVLTSGWRLALVPLVGAIPVAFLTMGCHSGPPPEFTDWVGRFMTSAPRDTSSNSYSGYAKAADEAEAKGSKYLDMVSFYPGQRTAAEADTQEAYETLRDASAQKCEFEFVPSDPFKAPAHQRGWRLLGRDIVWKVEEGIQTSNFDEAVENAILATKFGFDISGGGATDASLGLAIADEARKAIAPALDQMGASQLETLASGIEKALEDKPALSETIDHEHENMLEGVQIVQDAYQKDSYDNLARDLGPDSRSSIEFLEELHGKDYSKRPLYFEDFAGEADAETSYMRQLSELPVAGRLSVAQPKLMAERPWKKFSKAFFSSLRPLLKMNDATVARTRLLILEARIVQQIKDSGSAPPDLSQFPDALKTDPYSGKPFIYGSDGSDYHIYSVGEDLRDDGGETDETYTQPDLKLEREE